MKYYLYIEANALGVCFTGGLSSRWWDPKGPCRGPRQAREKELCPSRELSLAHLRATRAADARGSRQRRHRALPKQRRFQEPPRRAAALSSARRRLPAAFGVPSSATPPPRALPPSSERAPPTTLSRWAASRCSFLPRQLRFLSRFWLSALSAYLISRQQRGGCSCCCDLTGLFGFGRFISTSVRESWR